MKVKNLFTTFIAIICVLAVVGAGVYFVRGGLDNNNPDTAFTAEIAELKTALTQNKATINTLQAQNVQLSGQITSLESEVASLTQALLNQEGQVEETAGLLEALKESLVNLAVKVESNIITIANLETANDNLLEQIAQLETMLENNQNDVIQLNQQITNLQTEITGLKNTVSGQNAAIQTLQAEATAAAGAIATLNGQITTLNTQITDNNNTIRDLLSQITSLEDLIDGSGEGFLSSLGLEVWQYSFSYNDGYEVTETWTLIGINGQAIYFSMTMDAIGGSSSFSETVIFNVGIFSENENDEVILAAYISYCENDGCCDNFGECGYYYSYFFLYEDNAWHFFFVADIYHTNEYYEFFINGLGFAILDGQELDGSVILERIF